jgi:ankyrin repeat protein
MTPLIVASSLGKDDILGALIAKGANIHAAYDLSDKTALSVALEQNRESTSLLLLRNYAEFTTSMAPFLANGRLPTVRANIMAGTYRETLIEGEAIANATVVLKEAVRTGNLAEVQRLILLKADVNTIYDEGAGGASPTKGDPLFVYACRFPDPTMSIALLNAGANPNVANATINQHISPLVQASWNGSDELVTALLAKGADVRFNYNQALYGAINNKKESTALLLLANGAEFTDTMVPLLADGRLPEVRARMLASPRGNALRSANQAAATKAAAEKAAADKVANTAALKQAVLAGNLSEVQRLIAAGADVNTVYEEGTGGKDEPGAIRPSEGDPLLVFACRLPNQQIAIALVNAGADPNGTNARTRGYITPLVNASASGSNDVVNALLAKGANIHHRSDRALADAIFEKKESTALLLLEKGATFTDHMVPLLADGRLPAVREKMLASPRGNALRSANQAAATKAAADKVANTAALKEAVLAGNLTEVQRLIAAGADVNTVYEEGAGTDESGAIRPTKGDPLLVFACSYKPPIAMALLNAGANVNVTNTLTKWNRSPLVNASVQGYDDLVRALLAKGADVHFNNDDALYSASALSNESTALLLLAGGANFTDKMVPYLSDGRLPAVRDKMLASPRGNALRAANQAAATKVAPVAPAAPAAAAPAPAAAAGKNGGVRASFTGLFFRRTPTRRIRSSRKTRRNDREN